MATVNIIYTPWWDHTGHGVNAKITVGVFSYYLKAKDKEGVFRYFIEKHYGDDVVTEYTYQEEDEDYDA